MSQVFVIVLAFFMGAAFGIYGSHKNDIQPNYEDAYKQGQIDCIEGRLRYMPDTTTTYIEVP